MPAPSASVVVRAKNEARDIGEVLDRLAGQALRGAEVIVVDSGSTDGTPDLARARGARVIEIPARSFTFGGALNTGCEAASAATVVALSAHALPPDDGWLGRLVGAVAEERVACASGDTFDIDGGPLEGRVRQDFAMARRHPQWGYSNAAGAFRRELWLRRPFRADMPGTEDKEWAWHWLAEGWACVIGSDLVVHHDHTKDPVGEIYTRARREWAGYGMFLDLEPYGIADLARDWWSDVGHHASPLRARLSHRRAARLLGAWAARSGRSA